MTTTVREALTISVSLTDAEIDARVKGVEEGTHFTHIVIVRRDENAFYKVVQAPGLMITSASGSIYFGVVQDYDDNSGQIYIDLR